MKHISDMLKSLGDAGVQRTMEAVSKRMEADPEFYKKVMQMKDELLKDPVKMAEIQKSMQDSGLNLSGLAAHAAKNKYMQEGFSSKDQEQQQTQTQSNTNGNQSTNKNNEHKTNTFEAEYSYDEFEDTKKKAAKSFIEKQQKLSNEYLANSEPNVETQKFWQNVNQNAQHQNLQQQNNIESNEQKINKIYDSTIIDNEDELKKSQQSINAESEYLADINKIQKDHIKEEDKRKFEQAYANPQTEDEVEFKKFADSILKKVKIQGDGFRYDKFQKTQSEFKSTFKDDADASNAQKSSQNQQEDLQKGDKTNVSLKTKGNSITEKIKKIWGILKS